MDFIKMQGAGNDFVVLDFLNRPVPDDSWISRFSVKACNRRYGVGADTVVVLSDSQTEDFRLRFFDIEGNEAEMCGNAVRCMTQYMIQHQRLGDKKEFNIETIKRTVRSQGMFENGNYVGAKVDMGVPVYLDKVPERLTLNSGEEFEFVRVSMGNPHCVIYCENVDDLDLECVGPAIEKHPTFPEGTNVEFVQIIDDLSVKARVWERGAGETHACGSGACAIGVAGVLSGKTSGETAVHYIGGTLKIYWSPEDKHVYMSGELCGEVFVGRFDVD